MDGARLIFFIFRIAICIACVAIAKSKNRSGFGWGVFGFVFPIVALIWVACLKTKHDWESNPEMPLTKDDDDAVL